MTAPPVDATRADLELLLSYAAADLADAWVDGSAETVRDALEAALPDLVGLYGPAAATLAADWYDESRELASVDGRFRAIVADVPDLGATDALAGWGTGPLFQAEPDMEAARVQVEGGLQKIVGDMHRDTVIRSLTQDPRAKGWSRQTTGKSCDFCKMIAGRGLVYSARTANFSSHNHCDCIAVPEWGDPAGVLPYVPSQKFRTQAQRDANNVRLREFLRTEPNANGGRTRRSKELPAVRDVDAGRSVAQLRATLASLEKSLERFDSPGSRARAAELRRKIAART